MNKSKIILFVCKHNRFRSKIAELFFNKFNKNKNYTAMSAGLIPGGYPLDKTQVEVASNFGLELKGKPQPITTSLLRKMDMMIIVADNVPEEIFHNKKYGKKEIIWKIEDDNGSGPQETYKIISEIGDKLRDFVESLK